MLALLVHDKLQAVNCCEAASTSETDTGRSTFGDNSTNPQARKRNLLSELLSSVLDAVH